MRRRLFIVPSLLLLMLCTAVVVSWVRSYWVYEGGVFAGNGTLNAIYHYRGLLRYCRMDTDPKPWLHGFESHPPKFLDERSGEWENVDDQWPGDWEEAFAWWPSRRKFVWHHLGIVVGRGVQSGPVGWPFPTTVVAIPDWLIAICLGIPSIELWRRRILGYIRAKAHFCAGCGYDLRATPDRCPECGTVPSRSSPA